MIVWFSDFLESRVGGSGNLTRSMIPLLVPEISPSGFFVTGRRSAGQWWRRKGVFYKLDLNLGGLLDYKLVS